jgi:hypothetical protein
MQLWVKLLQPKTNNIGKWQVLMDISTHNQVAEFMLGSMTVHPKIASENVFIRYLKRYLCKAYFDRISHRPA